MERCRNINDSYVIPITYMAQVTRTKDTCDLCNHFAEDRELGELKTQLVGMRRDKRNMVIILTRREWQLNTLIWQQYPRTHPQVTNLQRRIDDVETRLANMRGELTYLEEIIIQKEERHIIDNEKTLVQAAWDRFEESGAQDLPFFFGQRISDSEIDAEESCPTAFPDQRGLLSLFEEDMLIVPAHVNL